MSSPSIDQRVGELFAQAKDLPPIEQQQFVARHCGDEPDLRRELQDLLDAFHEAPTGEFQQRILPPDVVVRCLLGRGEPSHAFAKPLQPGDQVGPYKLLEQIGEGGMGTVFMAEQSSPVERRIALKVIKIGLHGDQIMARFDAERQTLAMMDHPNIANVLDAGTTDAGLPYFVMELVKGIAITDYCDTRRMNTDQRLRLFQSVCRAVAHAHQKGVIHRDLKPSNVLVAEYDHQPVPKIIDSESPRQPARNSPNARCLLILVRSWGRWNT